MHKKSYEVKIAVATRLLLSQRNKNKYLDCVINHEEKKLVKVGKELFEIKNIDDNENWKPSFLSRTYVQELLKIKAQSFTNKTLQSNSTQSYYRHD